MNRSRTESNPLPASLETPEKLQLVERIAASPHLNKSVRLTDLLRYLVGRAVENPAQGLREQEIGTNLFGRAEDYDTNLDNIVRVQVSQLRKKLVAYFSREGRDEPILIEIPRGSYLPIFVERNVPPPDEGVLPEPADAASRRPRLTTLLLVTSIFFAGLSLWLWRRPVTSSDNPPGVKLAEPDLTGHLSSGGPAVRGLWRALFNQERPTALVLADSTLTILQDEGGRTLRLDELLQRRFDDILPPSLTAAERNRLRAIAARRYTSFADVGLVVKILRLLEPDQPEPTISIARQYQMRAFKNEHVILLGSKRSNPWVELVEPRMNFNFDYPDGQPDPIIINRHPWNGEPNAYQPVPNGPGFSVVAFFNNERQSGNVLILEGDNATSTEAAGEFVSSEEHLSQFFSRIGYTPSRPGETPPSFEVLLQTERLQGSTRSFRIVSYRATPQ